MEVHSRKLTVYLCCDVHSRKYTVYLGLGSGSIPEETSGVEDTEHLGKKYLRCVGELQELEIRPGKTYPGCGSIPHYRQSTTPG